MSQQQAAEPEAPASSPGVMALFNEYLPLVKIIAAQVKRMLRDPVPFDELHAAGLEGLWRAAQRFDPNHGVKFRHFANLRVRGAMIDAIRMQSRENQRRLNALIRVQKKHLKACEAALALDEGQLRAASTDKAQAASRAAAELDFDKHLFAVSTAAAMMLSQAAHRPAEPKLYEEPAPEAEGGESLALENRPDASLAEHEQMREQSELRRIVWEHLEELESAEAAIVRMHYFQDQDFSDIGRELGHDKSWVSRLHTRAITRLSSMIIEPTDR